MITLIQYFPHDVTYDRWNEYDWGQDSSFEIKQFHDDERDTLICYIANSFFVHYPNHHHVLNTTIICFTDSLAGIGNLCTDTRQSVAGIIGFESESFSDEEVIRTLVYDKLEELAKDKQEKDRKLEEEKKERDKLKRIQDRKELFEKLKKEMEYEVEIFEKSVKRDC